MRTNKVMKGIMLVLVGIAAVFVFGLVVMLLWNGILPSVLNVRAITIWEALGILVLSKILFGGFPGGGGGKRRHQWKKDMQEKWATMTPEEREKFRQEWKNRCGPWKKFDEGTTNPEVQTNPL